MNAAVNVAASPRRTSAATGGERGSSSGGPPGALVATKFEVEVPEGAAPGDTLYVSLPTGEEVKVVIPPEGAPGSLLTCSALTRRASYGA